MKSTSVDDKGKPSKLIAFQCDCGESGRFLVSGRNDTVFFDCPNDECREVFQIIRHGRRRRTAPAVIQRCGPLRLVR